MHCTYIFSYIHFYSYLSLLRRRKCGNRCEK